MGGVEMGSGECFLVSAAMRCGSVIFLKLIICLFIYWLTPLKDVQLVRSLIFLYSWQHH